MKLNNFKNKSILITGASGSIGSALIFNLFKNYNFKVIRAVSNDENGLFELTYNLSNSLKNFSTFMRSNKIRLIHGDIRNYERCLQVTSDIDIVIHAAAMKHVPICEYNPDEAINTNVLGTQNMLNASIKNKVEKFVLISTDKAANPQTIMGTTKLMAEKLTINANNFYIKKNFYCIRFGNIIGSRGSVLEIFKKQLYKGSNLTVTSSEMTRFFMDMNEAALGVLSSLNISRGGEIFIIKSMQAFKIVDLAKALISSLKNKSKIIYIGKKPGEKLHEELLTAEESKNAIENKKFIIINESYSYSDNIKFYLGKKLKNFNLLSSSTVKLLNKNEILEYLKKKINTN